jgi:hypothetical protein
MMFRIVFWDVLPCKIIVDRRFRGQQLFYTAVHPRRQFWTSRVYYVTIGRTPILRVDRGITTVNAVTINVGKRQGMGRYDMELWEQMQG